ncbi:chitin deacetylase 1-like [Penaeus japonicus]|uniref:chitin deacetylase 1-like n=1 Tax=Penaeus japonicus TaxID=27405 RepID=UPI001C70D631|nr:chitin deacetylase 1-like [Penaeus japonicus]
MFFSQILTLYLFLSTAFTQGVDFVCPKPHGQFASPDSCKIFYSCADNIAYRQRCAEGALYDGHKHECVDQFLDNIACGPQEPTEAPQATTPDPLEALPCDLQDCQLPYCHCSFDGTEIPGGMRVDQVRGNREVWFEIWKRESLVILCILLPSPPPRRRSGLEDGTYEEWVGEMVTMREIVRTFAGVRSADILGQRGPHLKPGKNSQLEVMNDYGFSWDSTINVPPTKVPVWPYSFDYKIPHECRSGSCPTRSFRGLWEMPMNSHFKDFTFEGGFCPYLDQCSFSYQNEPDVLKWLQDDFNRHYTTNRAPYMLALSTNWFQTPTQTNGLLAFIDWTMTLNDVYYTTMTEALQWVTTPQPLSELSRFQPWSCQQKVYPDPPCETPNSCQLSLTALHDNYTSSTGSRYMVTCSSCPTVYPWVWDSTGLGRERDIYEPEFRTTNVEDPAIL